MNTTISTELRQGIAAAKAGNKLLARLSLEQAAQSEPDNAIAWLWLGWTADSPSSMILALEKALETAPDLPLAQQGLMWARGLQDFDPEELAANHPSAASPESGISKSEDAGTPELGDLEQRLDLLEAASKIFSTEQASQSTARETTDGHTESSHGDVDGVDKTRAVSRHDLEGIAELLGDEAVNFITESLGDHAPDSEADDSEADCYEPVQEVAETETAVLADVESSTTAECLAEVSPEAEAADSEAACESSNVCPDEAEQDVESPEALTSVPEFEPFLESDATVECHLEDSPDSDGMSDASSTGDATVECLPEAFSDSEAVCISSSVCPDEPEQDVESPESPVPVPELEPSQGSGAAECHLEDSSESGGTSEAPSTDESKQYAKELAVPTAVSDIELSATCDVTEEPSTESRRESEQEIELVAGETKAPEVGESVIHDSTPEPIEQGLYEQDEADDVDGNDSTDSSHKPTILAVDDSPTIRKLVSMTLASNGYNVVTASDGVEALQQLSSFTPALLLVDVRMPRLDGYRLCKLIKKHERTSPIPVIMLSGKDGMFDKLRGRMVGCDDYITKPFDSADLVRKVSAYVPSSSLSS